MALVDRVLIEQFHRRLLGGDRTASEDLAGYLLPLLVRELGAKYPTTHIHAVSDGVTDAILEYCRQPDRFDVTKGVPLDRFLAQAAWRNLANLVRGDSRRKAREQRAATEMPVEHDPWAGNIEQETAARRDRERGELMTALRNPRDRKIFDLRLRGERKTGVFAKALGITHLSTDDQRQEVKRAKDRIDKIIRRYKRTEIS